MVFNTGMPSQAQIRGGVDAISQLRSTTTTGNVLTDERFGEVLTLAGLNYFARNDMFNAVGAQVNGIRQQRQLSGAVVGIDVNTAYVGSFPVLTSADGLVMDVDNDSQSLTDLVAGGQTAMDYLRRSGAYASQSEAEAFTDILSGSAVSTTEIMGRAAIERIPVFHVDSSNAQRVVPSLQIPELARAEVLEAVARPGVSVSIPQRPVTNGSWSGIEYVVEGSGALDYRIVGGESGGLWRLLDPTQPSLGVYLAALAGVPEQVSACGLIAYDLYRVFKFGAIADLAGGVLALVLVGFGLPGLVAAVFVYTFIAMLLAWLLLTLVRDAYVCVMGDDDPP